MNLFASLRAIAWLKRIAIAAERIAIAQETLAKAAAIANAPRPAPAMTVFESLDITEAERDWRERQRIEAEEVGESVIDEDAR